MVGRSDVIACGRLLVANASCNAMPPVEAINDAQEEEEEKDDQEGAPAPVVCRLNGKRLELVG